MPLTTSNPAPKSRRPLAFYLTTFLVLAAFMIASGVTRPRFAFAQEAAPPPVPEPDGAANAAPPPTPEPSAEPDDDASTEGNAAESQPTRSKSGFRFFIDSSGPIGLLIILLSVVLVAMIIRMFLEFRLKEAVPTQLVDTLDEAIKEKRFQDAYDACRDDPSFLARLVRVGVANLPYGRNEAKEAMVATADEVVSDMEATNSYLATIGSIGPLLGLLGTVLGMILAFLDLATVEGVQVDPTKLASKISLALVTTFEGLLVAVPAIFFFSFFRNRIIYIATETSKIAERTLNAFWQAAKQQQTSVKPNA